jgi:ATP-dependent protease ClpP protease subunit
MSLRTLPEAKTFARPQNFQWDAPGDVLARWAEKPLAAEEGSNTITIYDVIGEDWWSGGGFTSKRMSAALRSIGKADVVVNINSPGGDMFEGISIYNQLRAHPAKVTVNVMGIAASAASIIAMAADEINMGLGSFLMIHNAWGVTIGNRHEMRDAAALFEEFDGALADIYEARTGVKRADVEKLMDAETYMGASEAVKQGFADAVSESLSAPEQASASMDKGLMARRQTEAALAKAGFTRGDRQNMIAALGGARDAASTAARDAGETVEGLRALISTLKN